MKTTLTIEDIRRNGGQIRVNHVRNCISDGLPIQANPNVIAVDEILPRGGITNIEITLNGKTIRGEARCCENDNYNKKLGVRIAMGRAFTQAANDIASIPQFA